MRGLKKKEKKGKKKKKKYQFENVQFRNYFFFFLSMLFILRDNDIYEHASVKSAQLIPEIPFTTHTNVKHRTERIWETLSLTFTPV